MTGFLSQEVGLSLAGAFLIFNFFGFVGLLAVDATLQVAVAKKRKRVRRLATLIVFLPSMSFWSSAIGKDSIAFMATGLVLWASLRLSKRYWLMATGVVTMLIVRPHIAALMILALALSTAFHSHLSIIKRTVLGVFAAGAAAAVLPIAIGYAGLESDAGVAGVAEYIELRQRYNLAGGGAVDISELSLPVKMFTYLFRPMPFEAYSIPSLAASIDNVLLLLLIGLGARQMLKGRNATVSSDRIFMWAYSVSAWLILGLTTANLGIAVRQKWMFTPMLLFLFISVIGRAKRPLRTWANVERAMASSDKSANA
jgi:hypothetical protein